MASVCVIGAGMAGLCAAKYCIENGFKIKVFEQTNEIGGTWVFTDQIEKDEFGLDVHSSMYKSLKTNLPKEIMGFPDFPMPNTKRNYNKSYIPYDDVLKFLLSYCENFNIKKFIKFRHYVTNVIPIENSKWKVIVKDLLQNEILTFIFDFIMVCNGHYSKPRLPIISGMETFIGKQIHSHQFRRCDNYKDESVLIIGGGPSGRDIANELVQYARKVTISHHSGAKLTLPDSVYQRSDVQRINKNQIEFIDGSSDTFSSIIYCTGYYYSFPFLSDDCGIRVDDNYIHPLFKECINIVHPTMSFIGIPFRSLIAQMHDLQVRFVMEYYTGRKTLPSKDEMLKISETDMEKKWDKGWKKSNSHMLALDFRANYYNDLAETADIEKIKPVMEKLIRESNFRMAMDVANFRNYNYKIIDDENFEEI